MEKSANKNHSATSSVDAREFRDSIAPFQVFSDMGSLGSEILVTRGRGPGARPHF